ncbi:MAG: hydrogenase maturation protease [Acidilobaceae archaeon]|nr:hydrogenase maturation protease [Acidilobaceae archaeon]
MAQARAEGEGCARALIVGVGNPLYGDDGIGSCLATALMKCVPGINGEVRETLGLWEVGMLHGWGLVVFLDAARISEGPKLFKVEPGRLNAQELEEFMRSLDPHSVSPAALVALAAASGQLSGDSYILGIPALSLEPGGISSATFESALRALEVLERLLRKYGCELSIDDECVRSELLAACPLAREGG